MFVLALSLYNTWNRGVFLLCKITNLLIYRKKTDSAAELSNYEMANLRGRAGRLLKDFIGRTYVLDESAFADADGYDQ